MAPKTIGAGIAVIVAATVGGAVGGQITSKPSTQLTVAVGATETDKAVVAIAQLKPTVDARQCKLAREGTDKGVVLSWFCDGARVGDHEQQELTKMAGDKGVSIAFVPHQDGEKIVYNATVQEGELPNTDPVPVHVDPEPAKKELGAGAEEVKIP
jgi:hypothetical protein